MACDYDSDAVSSSPAHELLMWYRGAFPATTPAEARVPDADAVEELPGLTAVRIDVDDATAWLVLVPEAPSLVVIEMIRVDPERRGHGSRVLHQLHAKADEYGTALRAIPQGMAPHLIALYEKHGYVRAGPRSESWVRRPNFASQ